MKNFDDIPTPESKCNYCPKCVPVRCRCPNRCEHPWKCIDASCPCHLVESGETIVVVPSARIDYCVDCNAEHGYDCPKDAPHPTTGIEEMVREFKKEFGCDCEETGLDPEHTFSLNLEGHAEKLRGYLLKLQAQTRTQVLEEVREETAKMRGWSTCVAHNNYPSGLRTCPVCVERQTTNKVVDHLLAFLKQDGK